MNPVVRLERAVIVLGAAVAELLRRLSPDARAAARRVAAAACLPAALASVLCGMLPGRAVAAAPADLHARIEWASHASAITLVLVDGLSVSGEFYGFLGDWLDTTDYAVRYESWRQAQPAGIPRLGEPMLVVTTTGDTLGGTFAGAGPTFLALASANSPIARIYPFGAVARAWPESTGSANSWTDLHRRLLTAPPFIGVGLKRGTAAVAVSRESIVSVEVSGAALDDSHAVLLLVGAAVAVGIVVLCCVEAKNSADRSINDSFSTCSNVGSSNSLLDRQFGASSISMGLEPWRPGEHRRP